MSAVLAILLALIFLPFAVLVQAWLLRVAAGLVSGRTVGWPRAIVATVVAGFVQGCLTGVLLGGDVGCSGAVFGFVLWSAAIALLTDLAFGQALFVGLVMAMLQWMVSVVLVALGLTALLGGLAVGL